MPKPYLCLLQIWSDTEKNINHHHVIALEYLADMVFTLLEPVLGITKGSVSESRKAQMFLNLDVYK